MDVASLTFPKSEADTFGFLCGKWKENRYPQKVIYSIVLDVSFKVK